MARDLRSRDGTASAAGVQTSCGLAAHEMVASGLTEARWTENLSSSARLSSAECARAGEHDLIFRRCLMARARSRGTCVKLETSSANLDATTAMPARPEMTSSAPGFALRRELRHQSHGASMDESCRSTLTSRMMGW